MRAKSKAADDSITTMDKLRCALREIGYRKHVYKRRVADGWMTEAQAKREIALMVAIAEDYRAQATQELELMTRRTRKLASRRWADGDQARGAGEVVSR